ALAPVLAGGFPGLLRPGRRDPGNPPRRGVDAAGARHFYRGAATCYALCVTPEHRLEPATPSDIPAIRRIEADPRFEGLVGRWTEAQHRREMAKASSRYFVLRDAAGE